jgi:catechol 2,3-dioxygenase-like lactoylglutathione lyase family enzyme
MHSIHLLLSFALASPAQPAPAEPDSISFSATGAFFALSVPDLASSTRWYVEKLGLTVVMQPPRTDKMAVAILEGGGLIVELIQNDDAVPLSTAAPTVKDRVYVHGIFKAGVIVEDFDATLARLRARGVEIAYGPYPRQGTQRANAIIRDNAGNLIQLFGK